MVKKCSFVYGKIALCWLFCIAASISAAAPRNEMNLIPGIHWSEAVGDTLDLTKIPAGLEWTKTVFPTKNIARKLKSADHQWIYCIVPPEQYFKPDGSLKVQKQRSLWYRAEVTIPAEMLKNRTAHLVLGGASFKSGVLVNGKSAGETLNCTLPLDFNVTKLLKPGKNEIVIAVTTREGLLDPVHKVYLVPSNGVSPGVRGPVRLEFRPLAVIDDVFIRTSVKNKTIEFDITLKNSGTKEVQTTPEIKICSDRDRNQVNAVFTGTPVRIPAGKTVTVTIREKWIAPILWSPSSPELYIADISLKNGNETIDNFKREFGFREFSIRGKDFLLNGKRIVLLRNSTLAGMQTQEYSQTAGLEVLRNSHKVNSVRQHLGTCNQDMIYRANRTGMLIMPESAYSWKKNFPYQKAEIWLPGVLQYYKAWIRHFRNDPSVAIYNLTNETYWASTSPEDMKITGKIVDTVRAMDPTRPLQGDGDNGWGKHLDIINIHYPEGVAGTIRLQYPNASMIIPNDFEWLSPKGGKGWNTDFQWDRPLFLGEFGMGLSNDNYSSVVGDEYYTWSKWETREMAERNDGIYQNSIENPFMEYLKMRIVHLRNAGVAGLNPWAGYFPHVLAMKQVAPLNYHANVSGGGTLKRKIAVFNDTTESKPIHKIRWYLCLDSDILHRGVRNINLGEGGKWSGTLEIPVPETAKPLKARLIVRALWLRGKVEVEQSRFEEEINIFPKQDLSDLKTKIAVMDPKGSLAEILKTMNLSGISSSPDGKKLLIVAREAWSPSMNGMLDKFAESGGTVLMMPQKGWKPWRTELPERDPLHAASRSWIRRPEHPAVQGVDNSALSYWLNDNIISYETFFKPVQGNVTAILDCGGRFGLQWAPLLEIPIGKGAFFLTTLELEKPDAGAGMILANLIRAGVERKSPEKSTLNLLAGKNGALKETIALTGAVSSEGIGTRGPILADASAEFKIADLQKALRAGRTLWLHGFTPATLPKISALLPAGTKLDPAPKEYPAPMPVSSDPLISGISAFDLAWYRRSYMSGNSLFQNITPYAKSGSWVLNTGFYTGIAEKLTSPAFLVKIKSGKGTILFDTLAWENATAKEPQKAMRTASVLLTNLGTEFRFSPKTSCRYDFIDLRGFANMAFMDRKKGDGVGGWTDDGRIDMRFFLINHAGTGNGEEDGMAVDEEKFPENMRFQEVPFRLIDPKKNHGKAVLSFGSAKLPSIRMRETGEIPVGKKADLLWLLHATGWGGGKMTAAQYEITYADGSKTGFPVVNFVDVGDWFNMQQYSNCKIAWSGRNLVSPSVGIYMMPWKNPHPDKVIKTIRIRAGISDCAYILVAITTAIEEKESSGAAVREKTYAVFDFPKANAGNTLREIKQKKCPETVKDGIRTGKGSCVFYIPDPEIKEMFKKPFGIILDFTATEKPDGYCGGIFEPGAFRITLNRSSMKLVVETFGKDGKRAYFSSREPVLPGKRVKFELIADGKKMFLYRDGKLDTIQELPLPMKEANRLRFGVAGGKEYNFNGIFHRAELYKLAE